MQGAYYKTKGSVVEYIQMAKDVSGIALIKKLEKFLTPNAELLELGTGPGTDWKILQRSYAITGSDNSIEFLNYLISENPNGKFLELDAKTLKTDKIFEGIYSNKVLHHLKDNELVVSIKRQFEVLHPFGIICHSFWRGEDSEIFKGLYVNYHDEESLREVFEVYFEVIVLDRYQEFEVDDSLLLIARRK